jgi:hypothetical protein
MCRCVRACVCALARACAWLTVLCSLLRGACSFSHTTHVIGAEHDGDDVGVGVQRSLILVRAPVRAVSAARLSVSNVETRMPPRPRWTRCAQPVDEHCVARHAAVRHIIPVCAFTVFTSCRCCVRGFHCITQCVWGWDVTHVSIACKEEEDTNSQPEFRRVDGEDLKLGGQL